MATSPEPRLAFVRRRASLLALALLFAFALPGAFASDRKTKAAEPYALIFGTVYGPDNRALYGVPIKIRRAGQKQAKWEQISDHRGEFAQRVPAGKADYIVWTDVDLHKLLRMLGREDALAAPDAAAHAREVKVHVQNDERVDISLHLTE